MSGEHWEHIKNAFWRAIQDGVDPESVPGTDTEALDQEAHAELKALFDEHRRLDQGPSVAGAESAAVLTSLSERFEVVAPLGSGAFGDVYRVIDRDTGSEVALKVLRDSQSSMLYQFKREFRALADIRHRNVAILHELIVQHGRWMFTMELIDGASLRRFLEESPPGQRESRIRESFFQLATGLNTLHERFLLHRDLKPSNVLVARNGRVVIVDFGLARSLTSDAGRGATFAGTPEYMSPEQIAGLTLTPASDWYAFGVMLYEAVTGVLPFAGDLLTVLQRKQAEMPVPPSDVTSVAADLNELCVGLLATSPEDRIGFAEVPRLLGWPGSGVTRHVNPRQLIGRGRELRQLRSAYDRVMDGRPVVTHIYGSSGIGKTALIREFVSQLQGEQSILAIEGRCFESEAVPYQGLDDLVDHLTQHLRRLDDEALLQILPRNFGILRRMFPVLGQLRVATRREPVPVDSHELRRLGFAALGELLGRLAERQRMVLAIDDLQWGDMDGCTFLAGLLAGEGAPPILLILAYRAEAIPVSPWLKSLRNPSNRRTLAGVGKGIYIAKCESCHRLTKRADPKRRAWDELIALSEVKTDSAMSDAYNDRVFEQRLKSGLLEGRRIGLKGSWPWETFGKITHGDRILNHVVAGVYLGKGRNDGKVVAEEALEAAPKKGYKARSLNGIWATAPYLHNGSVPNLRTLLSKDRGTGFWIGNNEFDPRNVGLSIEKGPNAFWFDATTAGNSNQGHWYGVDKDDLSDEQREALLEYLKTL